jgi:single-strand DNA-binding protein
MSKSINQVTIMGNLTRDPESRATPNGSSVTNFSLALNRSYQDAQKNWQEATDYVDVVAWGPLGERVATYLGRGSRALVLGRMQSRSWDDKSGAKRTKLEVLANDVIFLDNRNENEAEKPAQQDVIVDDIDDKPLDLSEIPF